MVYDATRQKIVMFGGFAAASVTNETWEYDGTAWEKRTFAHNPSARQHHAMVYDSNNGYVIMFGGEDDSYNLLGDTWIYDGNDSTHSSR